MNRKYIFGILVAFSLGAFALAGFLACSKKAVEFYDGELTVYLQISAPGDIEVTDMFELTVTAPDMDTVRTNLEFDGEYLSGDVTVPAGRDRVFTLIASDSKLEVITYRGRAVANVIPGEEVRVDIQLMPVVPMLRIAPRGQKAQPMEYFSVTVKAYNIPDLYGASFRVACPKYDVTPVLDSARLGPSLDSTMVIALGDIEYGDYVDYYAVGMTAIDTSYRLTDAEGYNELVELFFTSPFYDPDTTVEVSLTMIITGLNGPDEETISLDDVFTDNARVEIALDIPNDTIVTFPDTELENLIREQIYVYDRSLYLSDVYPIQSLWGGERGIVDLTGLSTLVNLEQLEMSYNSSISDLSPLIGLRRLDNLGIRYNAIVDLTPLSGILSLKELDLAYNDITDITPLANLTNLEYLDLSYNEFTSLQALVDNPGLDSGDVVWVANVPLDDNSLNVLIPQLRERDVEVYTSYPMK